MKLKTKQRRELATIEYFVKPEWRINGEPPNITDADRRAFLDFSNKGIRPPCTVGVEALRQGKKWRDWHVSEFRRDLREGLLFASEIEASFPDEVAAYLLKATGWQPGQDKAAFVRARLGVA
jgi:hypothetical protein